MPKGRDQRLLLWVLEEEDAMAASSSRGARWLDPASRANESKLDIVRTDAQLGGERTRRGEAKSVAMRDGHVGVVSQGMLSYDE